MAACDTYLLFTSISDKFFLVFKEWRLLSTCLRSPLEASTSFASAGSTAAHHDGDESWCGGDGML